jgi:predicted DNA-binding protein with PD1-like motif
MKNKLLTGPPERSWLLVFEPGDEPVSVLTEFANRQGIAGARLSGIGGFAEVTLAYFNLETKEYEPIPIREQVEVMSLLGNVARFEGKAKLHLHAIVGKRDGSAHGGHLLSAHVQPTLEIFLDESRTELRREKDPVTGLPLLVL